MVSKTRTINGTTFPRYEEKAYAVHKGMSGSDELARRTASAQLAQWQAGFGKLHTAWMQVKDAKILEGVPKIQYGLYHSATVQYVSKVLSGKMNESEWLATWTGEDKQLDGGVLGRISSVLRGEA